MRRHDIQLLAAARQGDTAARIEVGRRYLEGSDGFPRHAATGVEHLTHASVRDAPQAARLIAELLPLQELLRLQQQEALRRAAAAGSAVAQFKLGVLLQLFSRDADQARRWWQAAADAGHATARRLLQASPSARSGPLTAMLRALGREADAGALALAAATHAREAGDLAALADAIHALSALKRELPAEVPGLLVAALTLAESRGEALQGVPAAVLRRSLEAQANQGDRDAAYALGRALCGIANAGLSDDVFAGQQNIRKGAAFLLRAADAGVDAAWLHLYRLHADHRLSVANPQMARYFLEKAAARGNAEAQRKLGALLLRETDSLADSEQAIHWLHLAAGRGDDHATRLLGSLVLPLADDTHTPIEAAAALTLLRAEPPWLTARLEVARHFGLTKLEALSFDPVEGLRPWGLVVGRNPFVSQSRLAAPRAVPALTPQALEAARRAAALFSQARHDALAAEGHLRTRSLRLKRALERHGLDESMFFADATATQLEVLRQGSKWAFRAREPLTLALAA